MMGQVNNLECIKSNPKIKLSDEQNLQAKTVHCLEITEVVYV